MGVLNLIRKIFTIRHHQQYILLCGSQRRLLGVLLRGRGPGGQTKIISYLELNLESGFRVEVKEKIRKLENENVKGGAKKVFGVA